MALSSDEGETRTPAGAHVRSLERGLTVLTVFDRDHAHLTLSEVARLAGLTRATARRVLLTLVTLGYVRSDGRRFALTPRVLDIGYAYLSSLDLGEVAQPFMVDLVARTHESSSVATLDGMDIVYVARVPTKRIMSISIGIGTRLPAVATSMGRVLLAELPEEECEDLLDRADLVAHTESTIVSPARLRAELRRVRAEGWALIDQELEPGVRSVAAPIRDGTGRAIAALNVTGHAGRVSVETLRGPFLDLLLETTAQIGTAMARTR